MNNASAIYEISSTSSLREAWRQISKKNMQSKGIDNVTIKSFKNNLDKNLEDISKEIRAGEFKFNKLRARPIKKAGSSKPRPLQIATVRDRVVMKALALHIGPTFQKLDQECSYAFIKGRGVNKAVTRIQELVQQGHKYYFEADIINFFGAVDREVLWTKFSRRVRQRSLLPLLRQSFDLELGNLESFKTELQELFASANSGIPQGGVLSPMLANFYLYEFDRAMMRKEFKLVRYADDFVVMCESLERAKQAHKEGKALLHSVGLCIHELGPDSKTRLGEFTKDGLIFLGIRFEGKEVFPTSKAVGKFKTKVEETLTSSSGNSLFKTLQKLTNLINGWGNCYKKMKVGKTYLELDSFIKSKVQLYLTTMGIRLVGKNKRKHMKLLGIPSLSSMIEWGPKPDTSKQRKNLKNEAIVNSTQG